MKQPEVHHRQEAIRIARYPPQIVANPMLPRHRPSARPLDGSHPVRPQHEQLAHLAIHDGCFKESISAHHQVRIERLHQVRAVFLDIRPRQQFSHILAAIHRREANAARRLRDHPHAAIRHRIALEPLARQLPRA